MPTYEWKNTETGKTIETELPDTPPALPGTWKRVYAFGVGKVQGAGGSPARVSKGKKDG